jgi:hypothetical protein
VTCGVTTLTVRVTVVALPAPSTAWTASVWSPSATLSIAVPQAAAAPSHVQPVLPGCASLTVNA